MSTASLLTSLSKRRGSAYVLILGIAMIVTVLGMGAVTLSRVTAKSTTSGNDWEAAGALAFSATEHAISYLNAAVSTAPASWRGGYVSGQTAFTQTVGTGSFCWAIKDETDGNLSADYLRSFRIYGIGTSGSVTRVYSVQVSPGGSPLDVLRTAIHSNSNVTLTGTTQAVNGPISSNASVSLSGTVNGAIEATSKSGNAGGTQTFTVPAAAKTMPSATVFNDIAANATAISYSALSGGKINNCLLSANSNPYGVTNSNGVYSISIGGSTLKIGNCRIVGTLLISSTSGASVQITGPVEWEPGSTNAPILIISGTGTSVTLAGSATWLTENSAGVNLNPASTPFEGQSDTDTADDFPPQYRGIIHIIGGASSSLRLIGNVYVRGTIITDCPVQTNSMGTFIQDPTIYAAPPLGYAVGDVLNEVSGTWRWDTLP